MPFNYTTYVINNSFLFVNLATLLQDAFNTNPQPILTVLKPVINQTALKVFRVHVEEALKTLRIDEMLFL